MHNINWAWNKLTFNLNLIIQNSYGKKIVIALNRVWHKSESNFMPYQWGKFISKVDPFNLW